MLAVKRLYTSVKKIIFILTYREGNHWNQWYTRENYYNIFPEDCQLIFLDNGNQESIAQWCQEFGAQHHITENNLGTTGGYNWFIRTGAMLGADRIAVMQADVEVLDPKCFELLFNPAWTEQDFVYFPNMPRDMWKPNGVDSDIGQFFSLNPQYFLDNDWLCDENYTITHFESIDLWVRMNSLRNYNTVKTHNLLYEYSTVEQDNSFYRIHSLSNNAGEHSPWFVNNFEYFAKKWCHEVDTLTLEQGLELFKDSKLPWSDTPWVKNDNMHAGNCLNRRALDVHRNIRVGQVPYPVEYEVNRYYEKFVRK